MSRPHPASQAIADFLVQLGPVEAMTVVAYLAGRTYARFPAADQPGIARAMTEAMQANTWGAALDDPRGHA
jgi:hypothetical protein